MESIGAGTRNQIDLPPSRTTVFGRQNSFNHLDFRNGLDAHDADLILSAIRVNPPRLIVGSSVSAINGDGGSSLCDAIQPDITATRQTCGCLGYTGREG